jgi:S-adenosylmethionine hydrolase
MGGAVGLEGAVPAVYFLTDYGTADEFVGVVHAVLHRLVPRVPVIDLSHQVPPFDVAAGASMLLRCGPHLGAGVVLAVVDPGVGTDRRAVAIRPGGGPVDGDPIGGGPHREAPTWLVGPDNGLLAPLAASYGDIESVVVIDRNSPALRVRGRSVGSANSGPTFDGRDVFAPAAAHILLGGDPVALGSFADPGSLISAGIDRTWAPERGTATVVKLDGERPWILTSVESVDRFGNVQTAAGPSIAEELGIRLGDACQVAVGPQMDRKFEARRMTTFDDLEGGELGVLVDSSGHLALVLRQGSAAGLLGPLQPGDLVRVMADGQTD